MIHRFLLSLLIIICFVFSVAAADDVWDVSKDPDELYEEGLISDDAYEALTGEDSDRYDMLIPSTSSSDTQLDVDGKLSTDLSLEESTPSKEMVNESGSNLVLMASVPTSGGSYSDPVLVSVDYAPDPPAGSLMEVLYDFLGKPVTAYHYRYTSSTQNITQYSCDILDYDLNWIFSLIFLGMIIYSIFRAGGALLSKM